MKLLPIFAVILFPCQALACLDAEQREYAERAQTITATEICNAVSSGIAGQEVSCTNGVYEEDEIWVTVNRGLGVVVQFDIFFLAASDRLSGVVSGSGFESHKFKTMLFLDFSCRNVLWRYAYEPRYLRGNFRIARNLANPNWRLYSDNDRISYLSESLQTWVVQALIQDN
jgi:hypothetical protein